MNDVDKNHDTKRSPKRFSGEQIKQRFCEFTNQRVVADEDDKRNRQKKHEKQNGNRRVAVYIFCFYVFLML